MIIVRHALEELVLLAHLQLAREVPGDARALEVLAAQALDRVGPLVLLRSCGGLQRQ